MNIVQLCSFENNPRLEGPELLGLASYDTNCSWRDEVAENCPTCLKPHVLQQLKVNLPADSVMGLVKYNPWYKVFVNCLRLLS